MTFFDIFSKKKVKKEAPLKIIVDNREKNSLVIPELMDLGFEIEFKQLPVGDYLIGNTAIERKTISDLKLSIINKRIIQQLLELKQYKSHLLLIEGFLEEDIYNEGIHENALRGFLLAVGLEFATPMLFTQDAKDTAKYLYVLARKKKSSESTIRASKILLSEEEQAQYILEGFPNIGPVAAKKLLLKFKSLKNIFNASAEELEKVIGKRASEFRGLIDKIINL